MKMHFFIFLIIMLSISQINAQNGAAINITGATADPSAMLDVSSINAGILIPRMSETQKLSIPSPSTGLLIYQTDSIVGFWYFNGSIWVQAIGPTGPTGSFQNGNILGEMLYWDGNNWENIPPPALSKQALIMCNGIPTWGSCNLPVVATTSVSLITDISVTVEGNLTDAGGLYSNHHGVCWNTSPNPTLSNNHIDKGMLADGIFSCNIAGLLPNTTYYVKTYATNNSGTSYGNEIIFTTSPKPIGSAYQGGVLFYILQPTDMGFDPHISHGLISATTDQSNAAWGCSGTYIGTSAVIGSGQANTSAIINGCSTSGIAASNCDNLVIDIYSDWYLPSRIELGLLYTNKNLIGGFANDRYWSSSESTAFNAVRCDMTDGTQGGNGKGNAYRTRCIRTF